jgi:hypothetical protein
MKQGLILIGMIAACAGSMSIGFNMGWKLTFQATNKMLAMETQHEIALENAYDEKSRECNARKLANVRFSSRRLSPE